MRDRHHVSQCSALTAAVRRSQPDEPRRRARPRPRRSRDRVFAAAAAEFAARGFAGASVDRIAAAARLNKAMIYYHFSSKAALYREILRDMFGAVGAPRPSVAASDAAARGQDPALRRGHCRRGRGPAALSADLVPRDRRRRRAPRRRDARRHARRAAGARRIIDEGVRAGRFSRVNPLLVHAGIIAPLLLFFASAPAAASGSRRPACAARGDVAAADAGRRRTCSGVALGAARRKTADMTESDDEDAMVRCAAACLLRRWSRARVAARGGSTAAAARVGLRRGDRSARRRRRSADGWSS